MQQDSFTLYKLIVLYMLDQVSFPITTAQISDFILGKEYTTFLTLQQVINQLTDAKMVSARTVRNRNYLEITDEGRETLDYFQNRMHYGIRQDIKAYLRENEYTLRYEVSVEGDYSLTPSGEYEVRLSATEKGALLAGITLSVPTEEMASSICESWQKKNEDIYQYLMQQLL